MPPLRLGPDDLLEYDARYGVLICRECQYCIQKSALGSHLLKHKIYRDERQRLLSSIAQLNLLEPNHVPTPNPASPPIDALPIISGYRCTAVGCGNLCASTKRMRRHRSEIHGLCDPHGSADLARPVKLQTFFRGTKLRYFEVAHSPQPSAAGAALLAPTEDVDFGDDHDDGERKGDEGLDAHMYDATPAPLPTPPDPTTLKVPPNSSLVDVNLQTLTYFHQFITRTSTTLPNVETAQPETHYWQMDVVSLALGRRWLMCGLLAISACHLAALADDPISERGHCERASQFFSEFCSGWEETAKCFLRIDTAGAAEGVQKAGDHITSILRCVRWTQAEYTPSQSFISEPAGASRLQSITTTIRGLVSHNDDADDQNESFAEASRMLNTTTSDEYISATLNRLGALPPRMAKVFGRPEHTRDVLATLSAIAALVECCVATCNGPSDAGTSWWGMTRWLTKVPDHFNDLVALHHPAALVVLAHWAATLVRRAEDCGCWFLSGFTRMVLRQIAERLPEDPAVHGLIEGLQL